MRFFLDNCIPIRHARALNEILKPEHSFTHLLEKFPGNTTDENWITQLAKEGDWIIISGDYRIGKSAHEKEAWHRSGLTAFFLSKGWTEITPLVQHAKLAAILNEIIDEAKHAKPGTGFSIKMQGKIVQVYP